MTLRRRLSLAFALLLAGGAPAIQAGVNQWTQTGPPATVFALATDPGSSAKLYASSDAGLWVSADHGEIWTLIGTTPEWYWIVAVDSLQPSRLLAAGSHLYRSLDEGSTWVDITPPTYNGLIYPTALRFDPAVPDRVYVAAPDNGLFRSDDGGSSWSSIAGGIAGPIDLAIDPADSRRLFVGTDRGKVFRSLNAGASWVETTQPGYGHNLLRVALAGTNSALLLAVPYCCGELYRSFDRGQSWSSTSPQGLPTSLAVDPRDPANLYVSAQSPPSPPELPPPIPPLVSRSRDGGATWAPLTNGLAPDVGPDRLVVDSTGTFLHGVAETGTLTYQIVGGGTAATVPTLSTAALGTLVILIATAGILALRRR